VTPEELRLNIKNLSVENILSAVKKELKTDVVYFFNQGNLISVLQSIFELEFPLMSSQLQLLLQKILYGIRNIENYWDLLPHPKISKSLYRFLNRLIGKNINLRKLSHWSIPDLLFNIVETNFGMNSRILIIITSITKKNFNKVEYIKNAFNSAFLLEIENRKLVNVIPVMKDHLISEHKINTLDVIKNKASEKYGYISTIINMDKTFLNGIISDFFLRVAKFNLFSEFKAFKLIEKKFYFNMYPEIPLFKFIKDKGMKKLLKLFLPIVIDKHEF
jgi:hypothetical protein